MSDPWPYAQEVKERLLSELDDVARRRSQLVFAVPIFGTILLAGAYFGVPTTRVPALLVALAVGSAFVYLEVAKRRLRTRPIVLIEGHVVAKHRVTSSSQETAHESVRHYLELSVSASRLLFSCTGETGTGETGTGETGAGETGTGETGRIATTRDIFDHVEEGQAVHAVVMPHDGAIYYLVEGEQTVFPPIDT